MKIAVDAFALSFARGTGIARYGLELSRILASEGHEVVSLFGLTGVGADRALAWPRLIQSFTTRGEAKAREFQRWLGYTGLYLPYYLLNLPVRADEIVPDPRINVSGAADRLPSFASVYNAPAIFRAAQTYSYLFNRPLKVHARPDIDVFHLTMPLPIAMPGARTVVTAHDMIPIVLPHSTTINLRHFRRMLSGAFARADQIFAVSDFTKRELQSHFAVPEEKIFVTYQAADVQVEKLPSGPALDALLRQRYGLEENGYFLFYGAIEPKKNLARIIQAMCATKTSMPLVVVGKRGWLDDDVIELLKQVRDIPGGARRVIRFDYLPRDELMTLLKGARALVFASLYEGFGIPVLEAMTMGCPVITSNVTSLPEVCGDAALYVDPLDTRDIAGAIDKIAEDDELCAALAARGRARAEFFSRARYAERLRDGYQRAMAGAR